MNNRSLFETLLHAEHEGHVVDTLDAAGFPLSDDTVWVPLGENEGNFSVVGNQQGDASAAFIEKVVNSIDAVLMGECFKRGLDPESGEAPLSMQEAVEQFFGAKGGRLDNLTSSEQTMLAQKIHVVATGEKDSPCYCIIDQGEGQSPADFPSTFLSTSRSSPKIRINFVQGKFNAGGSGSLQFCGQHNIQLIVSRRQPFAPRGSNDPTVDLWGFTVVRRRRPRSGERSSVFVYLAPNGGVLNFKAKFVNVLPGKSSKNSPASAYAVPLKYGTAVKLYNYKWPGRGIATLEARRQLERVLHTPCSPFRISETRAYKANYYSATVSGVWNTTSAEIANEGGSPKMEPGFPAMAKISLHTIGQLPIRIGVWRSDVKTRNVPTGIFFLVNGQVHGQFGGEFVTRKLKFDYIRDYILVSVDCTGIDRSVAEDLFMASRDRLRRNEHYEAIREALAQQLGNHQGLKSLNAARRRKRIEDAGDASTEIEKMVSELIQSDPGLANLFTLGGKIITSVGPGIVEPFKGRKFPSYFRLVKEPKRKRLKKQCPLNRTVKVEFETDAENDYFDRPADRGEIEVNPTLDLIEASHLWNGRFTARFRVPWDAQVGDVIDVRFAVSDVERLVKGPFRSRFDLIATPEVAKTKHKEPDPQPKPPVSFPKPNHPESNPSLELPTPTPVTKDEWHRDTGIEGPYDAFRVKSRGDGGYDFFVNEACAWLLSEQSDPKHDPATIKHWFTWGLALAALGMIRQATVKSKGGNQVETDASDEADPDLDEIGRACDGLARVIVPMFRVLYDGPPT